MTKRDPEQLPDELVFEPDGHVGEVALSCLADGEVALVPSKALAHIDACEQCTARLGAAALLSIGIGEALPHLALPHGLGPSEPANLWGALPDDVRYMNTAYYGGTLFMGAGLALLLLLFPAGMAWFREGR